MSGSNWLKHPKARLRASLLTALAALLFGVWMVASELSRDADYQWESDDNSREYAANTEQEIRQSCLPLAEPDKSNCIAKQRHEYRKDQREERDLVAQRKSANWAYIMGAAAVVGMGLSAVGVILVWATFRETQLTAKIANEALQHEREINRPWLEMKVRQNAQFGLGEDGTSHTVQVETEATNHGNSPAIAATINTHVFKAFGYRPVEEIKAIFGKEQGSPIVGSSIYPGKSERLGSRLMHAVQVTNASTGLPPRDMSVAQHYLAVALIYSSSSGRSYYTARIFHFAGDELPSSGKVRLFEACAEQHGECTANNDSRHYGQ